MASRPPSYHHHPAVDSRPPPPPQFSQPPPPPPPPPPQHQQQHHHHSQQQHMHHHHHQQQPPHQPPPPTYYQQPGYGHPPPPTHQTAPPPPQGLSLPPIQAHAGAAPPPPPEHQQALPPYRHPSTHDPREGPPPPEYQYNHTRSGHATPAPVNRSYSHDSTHQQRTPTTPAASGPYQHTTSAPDSHGAPQAHHMEHGQHHGYPNGAQHGLPPPPAVSQGPPPGHEQGQYMTPIMDNHHGYPPPQQPPPSQMYSQQNYGPPNASMFTVHKKKQMRATQACEQCRQRKQKCDEGSPCSFCKENSLNCTYRETPPAKTDKNMEKVISHLEALQGTVPMLHSLADKINSMDERVRRIEHERSPTEAGAQSNENMVDEPQAVRRKPELDDHRTAPHKLILLWPSVRPLLLDAHVDVNDGYVMEAEDRGVLRLYGRGEGIDEHDGTQPGGAPSPARSDDSNEVSAPTPPEGVWGTGFAAHPHPEIRRSEPYSAGGLKPDGSLDLDANTINTLYESYMRHIHVMHPFLDKSRVRKLFDTFIHRYGTGNKPQFRNHTFAVGSNESDRPLKRQRSNGSTSHNAPGSDSGTRGKILTERSPGNAIVYLVLALGKICAHKEPLPGLAQDSKLSANANIAHQLTGHPNYGNSPVSANIKPSPASPKSTPAHATPLSNEGGVRFESRSRRSSLDGASTAGSRNMDVVPGLAYYAKAAEILGDQGDGYDLVHAQMFLLAGLFKGQLARVKESMSWITMAGRATQSLLERYKLYNEQYWSAYGDVRTQHQKGQRQIKDKRQNLIVLASWTCLQLESDILAELRLPSSGIQSIENLLLMPHQIPGEEDNTYAGIQTNGSADDDEGYILFVYTAQMYLRRRLNQIHREMYGPECLGKEEHEVQMMLKGHEETLSAWRAGLPSTLAWSDSDPPPSDILSARLRAKYWGAKYIVNRPFLDYALHILPYVVEGDRTVEQASIDAHGNPRDKAEIHLFKAIEGMGKSEVWQAAKRCIQAAMQSTVAFDGIPNRLVVTNIHGTAHAQFGNMLVLSATYYNKYLKQLIDSEKLKVLLERTIQFLRRLAPISPTCSNDCVILEKINHCLFGVPQDAKHLYRGELEPPSASNSFTT
ncbi:hypothetical protein MBLNU230_g0760t1 [Neophaeotheca triangularis]